MVGNKTNRDELVFGRTIDWKTEGEFGTLYFQDSEAVVDIETVRTLLDEEYLDPDSRHNGSPTPTEFLEYLAEVKANYGGIESVELTGFVVSPERADTRIVIDGFVIRCEDELSDGLRTDLLLWDPDTADRHPDIFEGTSSKLKIRWD